MDGGEDRRARAIAPGGHRVLHFFPLMFLGGPWVPCEAMPHALQAVSDSSPLGAAVGARQAAAQGGWPRPGHLAALAVLALVAGTTALRLFRWQ